MTAGSVPECGEEVAGVRHMVDTHWTEQRSEDQIDYLDA